MIDDPQAAWPSHEAYMKCLEDKMEQDDFDTKPVTIRRGDKRYSLLRWIPVIERLPDEGGVFPYVLAKVGGMFYPVIARRSETTSGWVELGDQRMFAAWEITHWMHLPGCPGSS